MIEHLHRLDLLRHDRGEWSRLPAGRITAEVGDLILIVDTPCDTHTSVAVRRGGHYIVPPQKVASTMEGIARACDAAEAHLATLA